MANSGSNVAADPGHGGGVHENVHDLTTTVMKLDLACFHVTKATIDNLSTWLELKTLTQTLAQHLYSLAVHVKGILAQCCTT